MQLSLGGQDLARLGQAGGEGEPAGQQEQPCKGIEEAKVLPRLRAQQAAGKTSFEGCGGAYGSTEERYWRGWQEEDTVCTHTHTYTHAPASFPPQNLGNAT